MQQLWIVMWIAAGSTSAWASSTPDDVGLTREGDTEWDIHVDEAIRTLDDDARQQLSGGVIVVEAEPSLLFDEATVRLTHAGTTSTAVIDSFAWDVCVGLSCVSCAYLGCPVVTFPVLAFAYWALTPSHVLQRERLPLVDGGGLGRVLGPGDACGASLWMLFGACLLPISPLCGAAGFFKAAGPSLVTPYIMATAGMRDARRNRAARAAVRDVVRQAQTKAPRLRGAMAY